MKITGKAITQSKGYIPYCSDNQVRNFSNDTDSITIGILECKIPHISLHCP